MSESELFVVCKNCSAEVSPYVTECPYCGQRVRRRAPRLDRDQPSGRRGLRRPSLGRLREGEIPGIAPDTRPLGTIALIGVSLLLMVAMSTAEVRPDDLGLVAGTSDDAWRFLATPFVHSPASIGYLFIAMVAVGIFGTQLERRFGWAVPVVVFLLAGVAGAVLSATVGIYPALGANGAATGLLCAWLADHLAARRRGDDREGDMIGVAVIAAALLLLSLADPQASIAAAAGGAVAGAIAGIVLSAFRR